MIHIFAEGIKVPVEGGKIIEEFVGAQRGQDRFSVAHMIMPPKWSEPSHGTEFDEIVIVVKGQLTVVDGKQKSQLIASQVGWIEPSEGVVFSNETTEICEYWAICVPAYRPTRVYFPEG